MAIIHILHTLNPAYGGPPSVATGLARAQAELGLEVRILFNRGSEDDQGLRKFYGLADSAVALCGVGRSERDFEFPGWRMLRHLREYARKGNVFHLHGAWEPIILPAGLIARARGVRYVLTPHGMLTPWSLSRKRAKKRLALALVYKAVLNHAAAIHVLTEAEGRNLPQLGVVAPIRVLPGGIDPASVGTGGPVDEHLIQSYPWMRSPYVLYLGRLHAEKGIDLLIDAFGLAAKELSEVQLAIVGPDQGVRSKLMAQVRAMGLLGRVHFAGPIYGSAKYAVLREASMFCLPSAHESFGVSILEALASGVPVVISDQCNFPEVAAAGVGLVVRRDVAEMADAMNIYLTSESKRRAAGDAGLRLVAERYTWARIAERSVDLFSLHEQLRVADR